MCRQVLYLTEPIDEACVTNLGKYGPDKNGPQYELVDVSKEGVSLDEGEDEKKKAEEVAKDMAPVVDFLKKVRGHAVVVFPGPNMKPDRRGREGCVWETGVALGGGWLWADGCVRTCEEHTVVGRLGFMAGLAFLTRPETCVLAR